ncbi:hypothetical protein DXG01_012426 [Tephrocybe rancida]|nr:hypothetical protein DXG01_012426 [Tephrocybe rancida]
MCCSEYLWGEGLAQAAVHDDSVCVGIPDMFFSLGELTESQRKSVHVFTILTRVLHNPNLRTVGDTSGEGMFSWTMRNHGASIMRHMADWRVDAMDPVEVERKVEEFYWGNTVLFGHAPCHLVPLPPHLHQTPYATLPSLPPPREWPALSIARFYSFPLPSSHHETLTMPDPWPALLASSTLHPDDHPKLQRTLEHYARVYGERCDFHVGYADEDRGIDIEGVESLDGTLFLRVVRLVEGRLGREGTWDRRGFYERGEGTQ